MEDFAVKFVGRGAQPLPGLTTPHHGQWLN